MPENSGAAGKTPQIVIVDDNEYLAELLKARLEAERWQAHTFTKLADARRHFARRQADLILLDIELPDGSGLTILSELKQDPRTAAAPVIMLTASAKAEKVQRAIALGAVGYIVKPFNMERLVQRVGKELSLTEGSFFV